jgi:hypothetical protein
VIVVFAVLLDVVLRRRGKPFRKASA